MKKRIISSILISCLLISCLCSCSAPRKETYQWENSKLTMEIPVYWVEPMNDETAENGESLYLEHALQDAVMISYFFDLNNTAYTYTPEELFTAQTEAALKEEPFTKKGERTQRDLPGGRTIFEEFYTGGGTDVYCALTYSGNSEAVWSMFIMNEGNTDVMSESVKIAESVKQ